MWSDSEFRAKAVLYFSRAERTDDEEETFLWCSLGLEFLLRAPLAALNPVLLADPVAGDGFSALHAAGVNTSPEKEPQSVGLSTVIKRLSAVVKEFSPDDEKRAFAITRLRNRELHTSDVVTLANLGPSAWLPQFTRLIRVLTAHFDESPLNYFDPSFWEYAEKFANEEDRRVKAEVEKRISNARHVYGSLSAGEKENRRPSLLFSTIGQYQRRVPCRACGEEAIMSGDSIRSGPESLDDDVIVTLKYVVSRDCLCTVCGLQLDGVSEISAAGVEASWTVHAREALDERFGLYDPEPEYGND